MDANGSALTKSFGFDVAHEGEKVLLKVDLEKGYRVVAAYNGLGERMPLLQDEQGNYYITVPKGGGIYLSVELKSVSNNSISPTAVGATKAAKKIAARAIRRNSKRFRI